MRCGFFFKIKAYLALWSLCHHCRMVVLETRQTDDQLGLSNLYILEVAVNYVMLPWLICLVGLCSSPESTSGWIPCLGTRSDCHWGTIASHFLVGDAENVSEANDGCGKFALPAEDPCLVAFLDFLWGGGSDAIPTRCLSSEHSPEMRWMINWSVKEGEGKICFLLPQCYRQQLDAWTKKHGFSTTLHSSINVCVLLHRLVCKLWMKKKIETLYCRYTVIKSVSLPCHIHREMSKSGEGEVYVYPD